MLLLVSCCWGLARFALLGDLAGGRSGRGLVLRLPALNAGLDGRVPRAARSVLTARFRRAAPYAVLTCTQCPRRLRRLRTEPLSALPLSVACFAGGLFWDATGFLGRVVAIDGPSRVVDCGCAVLRWECWLDRRAVIWRIGWIEWLRPTHSSHGPRQIGRPEADSRPVEQPPAVPDPSATFATVNSTLAS